MLEIYNAPNEVLSKTASPVTKFDKSVTELVEEMVKALESATDPVGVGLAAPQIGSSVQLFIAKPTEKSKVTVFINPQIIEFEGKDKLKSKKKKTRKLEGCLSLKDIWGEVERSPKVTLKYQDVNGKEFTKTFTGFMSTIVQHEVDHLNGILFPRRVLEQKGTLYHSHKDEENQDVFEEIKI